MKIFISWSGPRSRFIADAFRWWLPNVIQAVDPFVSTQDIEKGTRGNVTISENLEKANIGVICLTPENQDKHWILFEAGALSKLQNAHVCTFLYDMKWTDVKQPLATFQHTNNTQEDILALCRAINNQLPADRKLAPDRLADAFDTWFPKLVERLKGVPDKEASDKPVEERTEKSLLTELVEMMRKQEARSFGMGDTQRELAFRQSELDAIQRAFHHFRVRNQNEISQHIRELSAIDRHALNHFLSTFISQWPSYEAPLELARQMEGYKVAFGLLFLDIASGNAKLNERALDYWRNENPGTLF